MNQFRMRKIKTWSIATRVAECILHTPGKHFTKTHYNIQSVISNLH